jgi:biotin carboxyl carrier protein
MAKFKLNLNGEEAEIEATRQGSMVSVTWDGETAVLYIIYSDGGEIVLEREYPDGQREKIHLAGHVDGDKRQIWVNGRFLTYQRVREHKDADMGDASLAATIPAVVSDILVQVGDAVTAGDKLILLESMKMIIPIQAPYGGKITIINCEVGESVQAGIPLLEIEEVKK